MAKCFYECGREATTDDHIIPVDDGGADCKENYVRACYKCNNERASRPIGEFLASKGLSKPAPRGITAIEYKLLNFPIERLSIIVCGWCEKPTVTYTSKNSNPAKFCTRRHKQRYARHKRSRIEQGV